MSLTGQEFRAKKSSGRERIWHIGKNVDTLSHACAYLQCLYCNVPVSYTIIGVSCVFLTRPKAWHTLKETNHMFSDSASVSQSVYERWCRDVTSVLLMSSFYHDCRGRGFKVLVSETCTIYLHTNKKLVFCDKNHSFFNAYAIQCWKGFAVLFLSLSLPPTPLSYP